MSYSRLVDALRDAIAHMIANPAATIDGEARRIALLKRYGALQRACDRSMKEFWVNVYPDNCYQVRDTKSECDETAGSDRMACLRVQYEVGQFDKGEDEK